MSVASQTETLALGAVEKLTGDRRGSDAPVLPTLEQLMAVCGDVADLDGLGDKRRSRLVDAAVGAGSYLRLMQPPSGWRRIPPLDEVPLVWTNGGDVFADVLHVRKRGTAVWTARTSGLPRRALAEGQARFGSRFVGVRIVVVAAPASSLLVAHPSAPPTLLADSHLWFHEEPRTALELAADASSGQVQR